MEKKYFACANSTSGFVNLFPEIFAGEKCRKLFIIKGGPGTGKSRLMQEAAKRAEKAGKSVERFYCSSDPDSLDGIYLAEEKIGMVDGTAPHAMEPECVGAFEQLLDLGVFWDPDVLEERRDEIHRLGGAKKEKYREGMENLQALGCLEPTHREAARACFEQDKTDRAAEKILRKADCRPGGEKRVFLGSLGMKGIAEFDTFSDLAQNSVAISAPFGIGFVFLDRIRSVLQGKKCDFVAALDPLYPCRTKEILVGNTRFFLGTSGDDVLDVRRLLSPEMLKQSRETFVAFRQIEKEMIERVLSCFSKAGEYHFGLEKLYSGAMDFSAKEQFFEQFMHKRLGL